MPTAPAELRRGLERRASLLARSGVAYNSAEAVVASVLVRSQGRARWSRSGSTRSSRSPAAWSSCGSSAARFLRRTTTSARFIALSFFALAAYVTVDAVRALTGGQEPDACTGRDPAGGSRLLVMPWLSWAQRRTGRTLGSGSVRGRLDPDDAVSSLSAVLLVGLVLNATLGWFWADPVAGLVDRRRRGA